MFVDLPHCRQTYYARVGTIIVLPDVLLPDVLLQKLDLSELSRIGFNNFLSVPKTQIQAWH